MADISKVKIDTNTYNLKDTEARNQIAAINEVEISTTQPAADSPVELWINPELQDSFELPEIDDENISTRDTWSSFKINNTFATKDEISKMYVSLDDIYLTAGIEIDFANKSSEKIGSQNYDNFNVFTGRKLCSLTRDGKVTYITDFENPIDEEKDLIMVEQPAFYYKITPITTRQLTNGTIVLDKARYQVSDLQLPGFKIHPAFINKDGKQVAKIYLSAYPTNSASGDVTNNTIYEISTGAGRTIGTNGYLACRYGYQSISNKTRSYFRTNIKGKGTYLSDNWSMRTVQSVAMNQLLMLIEFGPNLQTNLSLGITSLASGSYNQSCLSGSGLNLGNGSGQAETTYYNVQGTESEETANGKTSVVYRGEENFYGNIWQWVDGINIWGDGTMGGGKIYICNDFNFADDKKDDNYLDTGIIVPNSDGYIKSLAYSEDFDWLLMTGEVGGDSSVPIGDYFYKATSLNGFRCALLGSGWNNGLAAGPLYWDLANGSSHASWKIGARLLYMPNN